MKENFYLLEYLQKSKSYSEEVLDIFKNKFDEKVYSYGDQFKFPYESRKIKKRPIGFYIRFIKILREQKTIKKSIEKKIISNAYFSMNDELRNMHYFVMTPPWGYSRDSFTIPSIKLLRCYYNFSYCVEKATYAELLSEEFLHKYLLFKTLYKEIIIKLRISCFCLPSDMNVWDRITIRIAKELKIPTFLFLHGLPGRYNALDESRTDYFIVWGKKIKHNYINCGHSADKIFVSGHPLYKDMIKNKLRNSLQNVLVITHSMGQSQTAVDVVLSDRGNCILYLYMIENVLKKLGVNEAYFRPHPSENGYWYNKYIDTSFYKLDNETISTSFSKRTLIIGPTSTVFLESFFYGVNYIIFEPSINNIDLLNYPLAPPFDGCEKDVIVTKTEDELYQVLNDNSIQSKDFINRYISDTFSLDFIKELI